MEHIYQSIPGIAVGSAAGVTLPDGRELSLVLYFISISTLNYFGSCLATGYTVGGASGFDGIMMIAMICRRLQYSTVDE